MLTFNLKKENLLTFKRMDDLNVLGYKLLLKDTIGNTHVLDTIKNPNNASPVLHRTILNYQKNSTYVMPKDIYYSFDCPVKVYVNNIELTNVQYNYSYNLNTLTILLNNVTDKDLIEVSYYKDEIQYVVNNPNKFVYYIEPIINFTHNMGDHNILL
ncbi:hypothetical protein [Clostridium felsineum]|uniref:hypothetical protein n=1 Tax=Clostridium felsineum TaxID=36839 RepID=UPI00098C3B03|nr:hypothetical protein [Clostridium felsineum]URZ18543.1 hypothetical protein CLFE_046310 [Clostridium felsineum DSM 794]